MQTRIRKIGNSTGAIIPASIVDQLSLKEGEKLDIEARNNQIVLSVITTEPKYSLDELLAKCDDKAPMPDILTEWDDAKLVGKEEL